VNKKIRATIKGCPQRVPLMIAYFRFLLFLGHNRKTGTTMPYGIMPQNSTNIQIQNKRNHYNNYPIKTQVKFFKKCVKAFDFLKIIF